MKYNLDGVLIVEGKQDVSYLSSFINGLFFITNGYDLNQGKIDFLKNAALKNKLIILTDPDDAGDSIRKKLLSQINPVFEVKIIANSRNSYKKRGVAESNKEEIVKALKNYFIEKPITTYKYNLAMLISLSDNSEEKRQLLISKYRLINGNNKSLENQLNILKISPEEISNLFKGN